MLGLEATALTFGDWLTTLEPIASEISQGASHWWQLTLKSVEQAYEAWLVADSNGYVLVQLSRRRRTNGLAQKGGCLACCCKRCQTPFARRCGSKDECGSGVVHPLHQISTWRTK